jgi:iron complex outermembrane receptor protein
MESQSRRLIQLAVIACTFSPSLTGIEQEDSIHELPPLVVRADLLDLELNELPASISLFDASALEAPDRSHFEDLLSAVPNLSTAGGTNRARFFQVRGIGQNSQFGNEVPATAVGVLVDGIEFTGIASLFSLFDIEQVEVLKGPQSDAFGASAMAGLIVAESSSPTAFPYARGELQVGTDNLIRSGFVASGPLSANKVRSESNLRYRLAFESLKQDGFIENSFLLRSDTNERDEITARLKIDWDVGQALNIKSTFLYADFANGYDLWSLDPPDYRTATDQPGRDAQRMRALSIKATAQLGSGTELLVLASGSKTDSLYSYDWDWSNEDELRQRYGPVVFFGTDETYREREVHSIDVRLQSTTNEPLISWACGLLHRDFSENQDYFFVPSQITVRSTALYGKLQGHLSDTVLFQSSLRVEDSELAYTTPGSPLLGPKETLWGGKLSLIWNFHATHSLFLSLSKGYMAGGVNPDTDIPASARVYESESLISTELGWSIASPESVLQSRLVIFAMQREDIQTDASVQSGDGNTFALYKDNAAKGTAYGLEWELQSNFIDAPIQLTLALGLLDAEFDDYAYVDPIDSSQLRSFNGARQPYAPEVTFQAGLDYRHPSGWFLEGNLSYQSPITFDLNSGNKLDSRTLLNTSLGFQADQWTLAVWVRNLTDEAYAAHGFYFANEPPNYDRPRPWHTLGPPRQFGVSLTLEF